MHTTLGEAFSSTSPAGDYGWLAWIAVGCLAGWLADTIPDPMGRLGTVVHTVTAVTGAVLGGLAPQLPLTSVRAYDWAITCVTALVGAVCLLRLLRLAHRLRHSVRRLHHAPPAGRGEPPRPGTALAGRG